MSDLSGPVPALDLRALVREALRDALPDLLPAVLPAGAAREHDVLVRDDAELAALVARVVALADDPATADDLRAGRIRFRLAPAAAAPAPPRAGAEPVRVAKGAATERHVRQAEQAGTPLVLGRRAVLTPMARDRARTAGVRIVRERDAQEA